MTKEPKKPEEAGLPPDIAMAFSMGGLIPPSSTDAGPVRARAELDGMVPRDGRSRRRLNRTELVTIRTTLEIRTVMVSLADTLGLSYVQVFEMAISGLAEKLRDQNK